MANASDTLPTIYISHGGGPCFFMDWPGSPSNPWDPLAAYLRGLAASIRVRPKSLLVVSAHWEEPVPTVMTAAAPDLLFDYYGFPPHTYQLRYPAPGAPELARRVRRLLDEAGIESGEAPDRGFDHGVFVPLLLMYPDADIPVLQLSLKHNLDAAAHLAIGKALAPLRGEGVLIVGSGFSFHNMAGFFGAPQPRLHAESVLFDSWLNDTVRDPARREELLADWTAAPGARSCHPREEHLLPLMVAAGAAGSDRGRQVFSGDFLGHAFSCFQWDA